MVQELLIPLLAFGILCIHTGFSPPLFIPLPYICHAYAAICFILVLLLPQSVWYCALCCIPHFLCHLFVCIVFDIIILCLFLSSLEGWPHYSYCIPLLCYSCLFFPTLLSSALPCYIYSHHHLLPLCGDLANCNPFSASPVRHTMPCNLDGVGGMGWAVVRQAGAGGGGEGGGTGHEGEAEEGGRRRRGWTGSLPVSLSYHALPCLPLPIMQPCLPLALPPASCLPLFSQPIVLFLYSYAWIIYCDIPYNHLTFLQDRDRTRPIALYTYPSLPSPCVLTPLCLVYVCKWPASHIPSLLPTFIHLCPILVWFGPSATILDDTFLPTPFVVLPYTCLPLDVQQPSTILLCLLSIVLGGDDLPTSLPVCVAHWPPPGTQLLL